MAKVYSILAGKEIEVSDEERGRRKALAREQAPDRTAATVELIRAEARYREQLAKAVEVEPLMADLQARVDAAGRERDRLRGELERARAASPRPVPLLAQPEAQAPITQVGVDVHRDRAGAMRALGLVINGQKLTVNVRRDSAGQIFQLQMAQTKGGAR